MSAQEPGWIAVVGWDEMTHRDVTRGRGGSLTWHRTHARLLDDGGYEELPLGTRGVYHGLLLAALRTPQAIPGTTPNSTLWLSRKLGAKVSRRQLESLSQAGLIGFCASREQATRLHAASPRVVRDRVRDREIPKDVNLGTKERPEDDIERTTENGTRLDALLPATEPHVTALSAERRRSGT